MKWIWRDFKLSISFSNQKKRVESRYRLTKRRLQSCGDSATRYARHTDTIFKNLIISFQYQASSFHFQDRLYIVFIVSIRLFKFVMHLKKQRHEVIEQMSNPDSHLYKLYTRFLNALKVLDSDTPMRIRAWNNYFWPTI